MSKNLLISSSCEYFATPDAELVIYDTCDNRTLLLDESLAILLQIIRDADCAVSKSKLCELLQKENLEFDDTSLTMRIGKLIDLRLINSSTN